MKLYRMIRVLEYVGTLDWIHECYQNRGVKGQSPSGWGSGYRGDCFGKITEAVVNFPVEVKADIEAYRPPPDPPQPTIEDLNSIHDVYLKGDSDDDIGEEGE